MKNIKKMSISAVLLLASTNALAHSGHEAIGDVLHIEYLVAAVIVSAIAFTAWKKIKQRH
ncbi:MULTISPECIES: hypothetical protein [unclassified Marinobacter]|jgi:hypothetical protein|uniref:hypothetical protein n=1 Tax=unclassified Marinobacter TaxID=83889 RepID=UPI0020108E3D|nr:MULTISPECIES: hypothetical protein [unclassified Marinobacter]UQG55002.1 hypothetical protein MIH16_16450 [Marinobacter sp. M4C]UQG63803.1 hypothetical protein MIH17_16435 [Marinobacter sp. M2C]UQG68086.1 hypothetical protein MIH19_16450 [Marinobacter sp. M1C]